MRHPSGERGTNSTVKFWQFDRLRTLQSLPALKESGATFRSVPIQAADLSFEAGRLACHTWDQEGKTKCDDAMPVETRNEVQNFKGHVDQYIQYQYALTDA